MASPCRRSTFLPINCVRNAYSTEMPKTPLPPPSPSSHDLRARNLPLIGFVIGASMLFGVFYMVIVRFFKKRPNLRERRLGNPTTTSPRNSTILFDAREEFIDEEQGPQLDHPIWYIHTVGLDQSAIDSIAAFRFKKGEGLIDGTDCSVCLTEFEDDEALRLLPKCSHAFHVACIDMWLRSHKNCPLCRATVVAAAMADTAANSNPGNSRSDDGTRVSEVDGGEGEISGGGSITEIVVFPNEDAAVKELRRSVSMDASSSWDIYRSVLVAMNGVGRARVKKGKNLSLSSSSSRISGSSFSLYRTMKKASVGSSVASSSSWSGKI